MSDSVVGVIGKALSIVQAYKQDQQAGKAGLIKAIIAAIVALGSIAFLAWNAWRAGKERAKLLHERAVREEELHQAEVDISLGELHAIEEAAVARADELFDEIKQLDEQIEALAAERARAHKLIDRLSSWEDIDEFIQ